MSQVVARGEFTLRGSIVDFYPMGAKWPYRLEFFDDEIETIRTFDPEKQTSIDKVEHLKILPAREFPSDENAIKEFRSRYRAAIAGDPNKSIIYREVSNGNFPPGIEYYLPLFFESTCTLFDYFPANTLFILIDNALETAEEFETDLYIRYEQRRHDVERPILPPQDIYLSADEVKSRLDTFLHVQLERNKLQATKHNDVINFPSSTLPAINIDSRLEDPAKQLRDFIANRDRKILFVAESLGRREYINDTLRSLDIKPALHKNWQEFTSSDEKLNLLVAPIEDSVDLSEHKISIIAGTTVIWKSCQTNQSPQTYPRCRRNYPEPERFNWQAHQSFTKNTVSDAI